MSDVILKIFPVEEVATNKTELIRQELIKSKFLNSTTIDFYGDTYHKAGDMFCDFFEFEDKSAAMNSYREEIRIKIYADNYGVIMEDNAEEPEYIDRKNVLEIWNVDGNYIKWDALVQFMQKVTGDNYTGEWELL